MTTIRRRYHSLPQLPAVLTLKIRSNKDCVVSEEEHCASTWRWPRYRSWLQVCTCNPHMFCREVRLPTSLSFSRRIHGRLAGFYFFAWKATKDQRAAVPYEPYYTGTPRPDAHASLRGWIESYAERDMVWSRVVQGHETKRTGQLCECDYGSGPDRQAEWASGLLSSIFRGHPTARIS